MSGNNFKIDFMARITADVSDVRKQVNNLKNELSKLEIPKKTADGFISNLKSVEAKLEDFEAKSQKGIANKNDLRSIMAAYDGLTESIRKAGFAVENISGLDNLFDAETSKKIKDATKALSEYEDQLKRLKKDEDFVGLKDKAKTAKKAYEDEAKKYKTAESNYGKKKRTHELNQQSWDEEGAARYEEALKDQERWTEENRRAQERSETAAKKLAKFRDDNADKLTSSKEIKADVTKRIRELAEERKILENNGLEEIKKEVTHADAVLRGKKSSLTKLKNKRDQEEAALAKEQTEATEKAIQRGKRGLSGEERTLFNKRARDLREKYEDPIAKAKKEVVEQEKVSQGLHQKVDFLQGLNLDEIKSELDQLEGFVARYKKLQEEVTAADKDKKEKKEDGRQNGPSQSDVEVKRALEKEKNELQAEQNSVEAAKESLEKTRQAAEKAQSEAEAKENEALKVQKENLKNAFSAMDIDVSDLLQSNGNLDKLQDLLEKFKTNSASKRPEALDNLKRGIQELGHAAEKTGKKIDVAEDELKTFTEKQRDVDRMKQSVLDFFSVGNAIRLFKRAIRDAFNTVKDLDKAMTETAVVTDYSIEDMWKKLPEYTNLANKLGTTTQGAYETMTLFYQQGLKSDQAFAVGTETMKMARIANMDYAKATNLMTAALRGFNMELNQDSAQRINDVYSELAAVTAADTSEIATAMTKTASIANSANMEFETTAALLTQIIETTRESPETAGTALKTVIARFQELTKSPAELVEVDGEKVDANKIEHALRSVGVSLRDNVTGQFRDLDDVFLELASKWETLDTNTQRYIATISAGSRQQSRFLAMMSNFERTQELIESAQNSEGAGQSQFEKTLDSLDSKINKLHNAWDEFAMGLADSSTIKLGTDMLTSFLDKINKLTNFGDKDSGIFSSMTSHFSEISKILLAISAIKVGRGLFQGFTGNKGFLGAMNEEFSIFQNMKKTILDTKKEHLESNEILSSQLGITQKIGHSTLKLFGASKLAESGFASAITGGLTALAIAAAVALAFAGIQYYKENYTLEGQIKKLEEANKGLTSGAEEIQSAYESASKTMESLGDKFSILESLTKGTDEWKKAVEETNAELFKMVETIPELASAITFKNGVGELNFDKAQEILIDWKQRSDTLERAGFISNQALLERQELKRAFELQGKEIGAQAMNPFYLWTRDSGPSVKEYANEKAKQDGRQGLDHIIEGINSQLDYVGQKLNPQMTSKEDQLIESREKSPGMLFKSVEAVIPDFQDISNFGVELAVRNATQLIADYMPQVETSKKLAKMISSGEILEWGNKRGGFKSEYDMAKAWLNEYDPEIATLTLSDFNSLKQQGKEYQNQEQLTNFQNQRAINSLQEEVAFSSQENRELVGQLGDSLGSDIYEQIKKEELSNLSLDKIGETEKIKFAALRGWHYIEGNTYVDQNGEEKIANEDMVRYGLASQATDKTYKEFAVGLDTLLQGMTSIQKEQFGQLFSEEGIGLTSKTLEQFKGFTAAISTEDEAIAGLNGLQGISSKEFAEYFGADEFTKLAKELKKSPDELAQLMIDNINSANERINDQRLDILRGFMKTGAYGGNWEAALNKYSAMEKNATDPDQFREAYASLVQSFSDVGDNDLSRVIFDNINQQISEGLSTQGLADLSAFGQALDFSAPLKTMKALRSAARDSTTAEGRLANSIIKENSLLLSGGAQFRDMLRSTEFDEISEDITDVIKAGESFDSDDILSLADDYESLQQILDETSITAEGLAEALEAVAMGDVSIDELTDTVIAALGAFDTLNSLVGETMKEIEDFDPGLDEGDAASFVSDAHGVIDTQLNKGAYGNHQLKSYMDYLFNSEGYEWDKDLTPEQRIAKMKDARDKLGKNTAFMRDLWQNVVNGQDFWGNEASQKAFSDLGLSVTEKNDNISIEPAPGREQNLNTDNLTQALVSQLGISEQLARLMITDFKNYDTSDMSGTLEANDRDQAIQKAYDHAINKEGKYFDQREAQTLDKLYGWKQGTAWQQITALDQRNGGGLNYTNFYDELGMLKETSQLVKEVTLATQHYARNEGRHAPVKWSQDQGLLEHRYKWSENDPKRIISKENIYDIDAMTERLQQMGIQGAGAVDLINETLTDTVANGNSTITIKYRDAFNQIQEAALEAGQTYEQAIAQHNQEIQFNQQAEAIKKAFENFEIKFVAGDSLTDVTNEVSGFKDEAEEPISIHFDSNSDQIAEEIKTLCEGNYTAVVTIVPDDQTGLEGSTIVQNKGKGKKPYGKPTADGNHIATPLENRAKGVVNAPHASDSLTGEEGIELVQSGDKSYLVGINGPEIAHIKKGDTVYTAEQTKKILSNKPPKIYGSFKNGQKGLSSYGDATDINDKNKGGNGGKKGKEEKPWENPYDALYNLIRQIQEELRERNRIERAYQKELKNINLNAKTLAANTRKQLEQLDFERSANEARIERRKEQISAFQQENSKYNKYGSVGEDGKLRIDWELINSVTDAKEGQNIEEYIGQLEEWTSDIDAAEDALWDIEDQIEEINESRKEGYLSTEKRIKDALIKVRQDEIDELSAINENITDTNSKVLSAMENSIAKIRQDRENEKTEQELGEKYRNLAYLSQDTSGANGLEMLDLEKEIDESEEAYTDELIDQKITALQEQNDMAAEQRDHQIALMETQLLWYEESGQVYEDMRRLLEQSVDAEGNIIPGSQLENILKAADNWSGMSEVMKKDWNQQFKVDIGKAYDYLANDNGDFKNDMKKIVDTIYKPKNVEANDDKKESSGSGGGGKVETKPQSPPPQTYKAHATGYSYYGTAGGVFRSGTRDFVGTGNTQEKAQDEANKLAQQWSSTSLSHAQKQASAAMAAHKNNSQSMHSAEYKKAHGLPFKTGGLADYTGPAWLDGTKSHPELVLNAQDTQNFIQLKDILGSFLKTNGTSVQQNNGETSFDIDINVENVSSDYDVERMASKIKTLIKEDAYYRNNNTVNLTR